MKNKHRSVTELVYADDEDDKVSGKQHAGKPNAYWQRVRDAEEDDVEPDTYGGGYRGVRAAPHGGQATVSERDLIGSDEDCWCGRPAGHDWPGKDKGRKHPKEGNMNTQITDRIERKDLRAYHARLQDFVMQCINDDKVRFRIGKNSVILYPPDGTNPATVYARNSDRQVKALQKWYVTHVHPFLEAVEAADAGTLSETDLAKLQQKVNDPKEHPPAKKAAAKPVKQPVEEVPVAPPVAPPQPVDKPVDPPTREASEYPRESIQAANKAVGDWRPYIREKTGPSPNIETNGTHIRCRTCLGTEHELLSDNPRSAGGHNRIWHTDTSTLYSPEAREKAVDSWKSTEIRGRVEDAIAILHGVLGNESPDNKIKALEKEVARLTRENAKLVKKAERPDNSDALAKVTARAEEAETKLALLRETLQTLG